MNKNKSIGYLASEGFEEYLLEELGKTDAVYGRLVLAPPQDHPVYWADNIWNEIIRLPIHSPSNGAKKLLEIQSDWAMYPFQLIRQAQAIQSQLPPLEIEPLGFPARLPKRHIGSWTMLTHNLLLVSPDCSSPFPHGQILFAEDNVNPPSRAYLKLWETFFRIGKMPKPGQFCLDMGGSPGGWAWVLQQLGAAVLSIDRAPLAPHIQKLPKIQFQQHNAFTIRPQDIGPVDWFFSDVICYPEKLWEWVQIWLESGLCQNFVCSIKFQKQWNREVVRAFAAVPGSQVMHLSCNKHELTWVKLAH